ncbi:DUF5979 domain-containing protein [Agromyces salentinus]|uniref:DUF5979 domain-containing protein n=1 Tax=Agromyces salentinus TaxID=269421 RepID=A0ABN2MII9_9MICO|nr:DUF5979 domain-containing protein [Agromyces salentinus]
MSVVRRVLAGIGAIILTGALVTPGALSASAAPDDAEFTTFTKVVTPPDTSPYAAGEQFSYTITLTCNSPIVDICVGAQVTDALPAPLVFDPSVPNPVVVSAGSDATVTTGDTDFTVDFTETGTAGTGLATGQQVSITVFVQVPADASADYDGEIVNTATASAENALPKDATVPVELDIPSLLDSTVVKTVDDHVADGQSVPSLPGQPVDYTIGGGNASNQSVDAVVVQDPAEGVASPFDGYLDFTGITSITPPPGADQVQIEYRDADGNWVVAYPTGPIPTDFTDIPGVDPASDVKGLRFTFTSSTGDPIPPGENGTIGISAETNDTVLDIPLGESVDVPNTASSNVVVDDVTTDPNTADGDVVISNTGPAVDIEKSFADPVLLAGDSTTATIESANGPRPVTSMTIDEPTTSSPNLADQGLTFDGFGDITWPQNATGASITYTYADGTTETLDTTTPDTLPDPTGDVVGFSVTFTGPILPNASAQIPFDVTAQSVDGQADIVSTNDTTSTVTDSTGQTGTDEDAADITRQPARVSTVIDKDIVRDEVWDVPGSTTDVTFLASVNDQGENASTVGADQLVISDPADPQPGDPPSTFWNVFDLRQISAGVPADANLTVEYWDGEEWVTLPGAELIEGPATFNTNVPADLQDDIQGIRFVYTPKPGETLPPGFQVAPRISVATRDQLRDGSGSVHDAAVAADPLVAENTASSTVMNPDDTSPEDNTATDGDQVDVNPLDPDEGVDLLEKQWLDENVNAFSGDQRSARISWATEGLPFDSVAITDDPSAGEDFSNIAASAFDAWNLAVIEPIDGALDPEMQYDRIATVELFDDTADAWVDITAAACGAVDTTGTDCDGGFPGYELSDAEQESTLGVRLTYVEGSNRGGGGPAAGSGVAASYDFERNLDLTFQLRDEKRSGGPVVGTLHDDTYNSGLAGVVTNTARAEGEGPQPVTHDDSDDITILDTVINTSVSKAFDQDSLPVPPDTADQADYPLVSSTMTAVNQTEANIGELRLDDPAPTPATTTTYDYLNLYGIDLISVPEAATVSTVTLTREGGGTEDFTIEEALALSPTDLADVIGFSVVHTDPDGVSIQSEETTSVVLTFQLREFLRGQPGVRPTTADTVTNVASSTATRPGGDPEIDEAYATDDDSLTFADATYGVNAGKSIDPPSRYEDESPDGYTVTIGGQPTGNVRTTVLTLTDDTPTFWNAFEFASFPATTLPAGIGQLRVSALVGVEYSAAGAGAPLVQTCAGDTDLTDCWVVGDWQDAVSNVVTPVLPDGVAAGDVRGLRFDIRKDADETNWESPRNPIVSVRFLADRLENLHYGPDGVIDSYPVPSTLPGLATAPGETVQGTTTDDVDVHGTGSWETPDGVTWEADAIASDTTILQHRVNAISVVKSPGNGSGGSLAQQFPPASTIPYSMTITNTGAWAMTGLELTDQVATDASGSLLVADPDADEVFEFTLTDSSGASLPTDGFTGELDEATGLVTITVPDGFVFNPGDVLVIDANLIFRPGLAPGTPVGNTISATSDRDFETCAHSSNNVPTPDTEDVADCAADTTVTPAAAAPISIVKAVKGNAAGVPGVDPADPNYDDLGVLNTAANPSAAACAAPNAGGGYYVNQCVPITRPGGVETWRISFTNRGNVPADRIAGIDVLPAVGDTGVVVGSQRGSEWAPIFIGNLSVPAAGTAEAYYMASVPNQACNATDIQYSTLGVPVPDSDPCFADVSTRQWIAYDDSTPAAELATARALKLVFSYPAGTGLPPGITGSVTYETQTPAVVPDAYDDGLPVAWNTVAAGSRATFQGTPIYQGPVEPVRAGVAVPTGQVQLQKEQVAPDTWTFPLPDSYEFDVQCESLEQPVDLVDTDGADVSPLDVPADGSLVEVGTGTNLPLFSDCTVQELFAQGSTVTYDPEGTADRSGEVVATRDLTGRTDIHHPFPPDPVEDVTLQVTNTYEIGGFSVTKEVERSTAVDQDGNEIAYNPEFTFVASCIWLGQEIIPEDEREFTIGEGETVDFGPLPVGADCSVEETDVAGATTSQVVVTEDGVDRDPVDVTTPVEFVLLPDEADGTHLTALTATNAYTVGGLEITKDVTGAGADAWAPDDFTLQLVCTWDQATTNPVYDDTFTISDGETWSVDNLPTGADCTVTEPEDGDATEVTFSPNPVTIGDTDAGEEPIAVAVTNDFRVGGFQVEKTVAGSGVGFSDDVAFTYAYTCTYAGETVGEGELSITGDGTAGPLDSDAVTGLPVGAECVVTETDDGGADATPEPVTVTIPDEADGVAQVGVAEFENRFTAGTIAVTKVVEGDASEIPGIPGATYTVHVTCAVTEDGDPLFDGDVEVIGGETVTVTDPGTGEPLLLPLGTHCWGEETDDAGATSSSVDLDSFENAAVVVASDEDEPQPLEITATNTFAAADLVVAKAIDGNPDHAAGVTFTILVTCTLDRGDGNPPVVIYDQEPVTIEGGQSQTLDGIPVGSDCYAEEPDGQGAYDITISNTADNPIPVTGDVEDPDTITVTNDFPDASFTVVKDVDNGGAENQDGEPIDYDTVYSFTATCEFQGTGVLDESFALGDGGEQTFNGLPAGAECTVTETDQGGAATSIVLTQDGAETDLGEASEASFTLLPDAEGTTVTSVAVTNAYTVGSIAITKAVTGEGAEAWAPDEFDVQLVCTLEAADPDTVYDDIVTIGAGETVTVGDLPTGADCTVTEPDTAGATEVTIDPESVTVGVVGDEGDPVAVTVTNDFRVGGFQIQKNITGPGTEFTDGVDFVYGYTCTYLGAVVGEGELTITGDGTAGPLLSEEVTGLPVGSSCAVTETDDGGADATPDPVTVVIPDVDEQGAPQVVDVDFVNPFSAGTIAVSKVVEGAASEIPEIAGATYTVQVTCSFTAEGDPVFEGDVEVVGGETTTVLDAATGEPLLLPLGTHCWGVETDAAGATSSSVDFDSFENAVIVVASEEEAPQALVLTATNTFEYGELVVAKALDGNPDHAEGVTFEILVTCTFDRGDGNEPIVIYDQEPVTIEGGQSETLTDIPVGSECYAEEPDGQGAYEITISNTADNPIPVTGDVEEPVAITVTNEFPDASFIVAKDVDNGGAENAGGDPIAYDTVFSFTATCEFEGETVLDEAFDLADGEEQTYDTLPAGSECTVTETDQGGASTSIVIEQGGTETDLGEASEAVFTLLPDIEGVIVTTVAVTNTFTVGTVEITKAVTGTGADAWGGTFGDFEVELVCTLEGADPDVVYSDTRTLTKDAPGDVWLVENLPTGADCTVAELDDGEATESTVTPSEFVIGDDTTEDPVAVTVENEFRTGGLNVLKAVTGPGVPEFSNGPFLFQVECTYDGQSVVDQELVVVGDGTEGPFTSETIGGIPVGSVCVVTETFDADADTTPPPVTVTIEDQATEGVETVVTAVFLNVFSLGTIDLTKEVDGSAADESYVQDATFTVQVTCQLDVFGTIVTVFSGPVEVGADETVPVLREDGDPLKLPYQTHCFGEETDAAGATESTIDFDSYDNAAVVDVEDEPQTLELTATNTFEEGTVDLEKTVSGAVDQAAGKTFMLAVTCTFDRGEGNDPYVAFDAESVPIAAGETVTLTDLPIGTECWAEETDAGGAIGVTVSATEDTPVVVGLDETATITVDNEFAAAPPVTGVDGAAVWAWIGYGALLIAFGAGMVLLARRRRQA